MGKPVIGLIVLIAAIAAVNARTQDATGAIAFANGYWFANGAFVAGTRYVVGGRFIDAAPAATKPGRKASSEHPPRQMLCSLAAASRVRAAIRAASSIGESRGG